jgi:hypothetical protein
MLHSREKSEKQEFRKYFSFPRENCTLPTNLKLTPTVESRDALGIEDYRKKSCIPIHICLDYRKLFGLPEIER